MRFIALIFALCAACSPEAEREAQPSPERRAYATQTAAPAPDYRALLAQLPLADGAWQVREASAPLPPDAKAIGELWIERLRARGALLGHGLAGKGPDGPVSLIDTGLTLSAFDGWVAANGWTVPRHIRWSFVPAMTLPSVSAAARPKVRIWPAATARTGAQNEALLRGKVELRDGCFFVGLGDEPVDKLAWFHAEIGLDVDAEGHVILRNRVSGQTLARIGEALSWGGPASAPIDAAAAQALHAACGPADIYVVGSPESSERFLAQHPHLRDPASAAPPPPAAPR